MVRKTYVDIDVVTAARTRIRNIFSTAPRVMLSTSGGKDSACLSELIYEMCLSGEIDKAKLRVQFVDEEAIYPCVERVVRNWRVKWLSIGVRFDWYCVPCRHYSCFNQLSQEESFVLWEPGKDWIREMPPFAIREHPLLRPYKDTYQDFLARINKAWCVVLGVRAAESIQRRFSLANSMTEKKQFPIYDWSDTDVWRFIRERNIEIPEAYMYMYQVGLGKKDMRISQFFSVDTAKSLVRMCEFYPDLFERICRREPNAYLAMLYFDTELFRRSKSQATGREEKDADWRSKSVEYMKNSDNFDTKEKRKLRRDVCRTLLKFAGFIRQEDYKTVYNIFIGGDPKRRTLRALDNRINMRKAMISKGMIEEE